MRHVSVPLPHHTVRTPPAWRTPPPPRHVPGRGTRRGAGDETGRKAARHGVLHGAERPAAPLPGPCTVGA
ncbi:hypothetical protein FM106_00665 [Brachybacterium faecium]|nr:hypothetical protein FM106_00665 [Brachybacterium faecium]